MPRFRLFDAGAAQSNVISGRRATAADFGGGEGLIAAGSALKSFAGDLLEKENRADVSRVRALRPKAVEDLTNLFAELQRNAPPGAPKHLDSVKSQIKQYYADRQDQATTPQGKTLLAQQEADLTANFSISAAAFQASSMGLKVKTDYLDGVNSDRNTLFQTPNQLAFLLAGRLAELNDPNGALFNSLDAKSRLALFKTTERELTRAGIQGLIRLDPTDALSRLEGGEFDATLDADDVSALRTEAGVAIRGRIAADAADAKRAKEAEAIAVAAEQAEIFDILVTGQDNQGNPVSLDSLRERTLGSNLPTFGVGSKNSVVKSIDLRASGQTSAEFDTEVTQRKNDLLREILTLKNLDGSPIDPVELMARIVGDRILDPFGSNGSKATLVRLLESQLDGATDPVSVRQQEIYALLTTGVDKEGNRLSDAQIIQVIREDDLLSVDGAAGKQAFERMVLEARGSSLEIFQGSREDAAYQRIFLPRGDPNRLESVDFTDPALVARVGGYKAAQALKLIADRVASADTKIVEERLKEFYTRFKGAITNSNFFRQDPQGDDRFVSFKEQVREIITKAEEAGEDVLDLLNSGSPNYIGDVAQGFSRSIVDAARDIPNAVKGVIIPFRRPTPGPASPDDIGAPAPAVKPDETLRRPGETPQQWLDRVVGG